MSKKQAISEDDVKKAILNPQVIGPVEKIDLNSPAVKQRLQELKLAQEASIQRKYVSLKDMLAIRVRI